MRCGSRSTRTGLDDSRGTLTGWIGIDRDWLTNHHRVALDMIVLNIGPVLCLIGVLVAARARPTAAASATEK
jgi:hypothetical protein